MCSAIRTRPGIAAVARLYNGVGLSRYCYLWSECSRMDCRGKPVRTTISDKAGPSPLDHVNRVWRQLMAALCAWLWAGLPNLGRLRHPAR